MWIVDQQDPDRFVITADAGKIKLELTQDELRALRNEINRQLGDDLATVWISTGQAQRRYGIAKSTARYRAANDSRCRKSGNAWECPREVWEEGL